MPQVEMSVPDPEVANNLAAFLSDGGDLVVKRYIAHKAAGAIASAFTPQSEAATTPLYHAGKLVEMLQLPFADAHHFLEHLELLVTQTASQLANDSTLTTPEGNQVNVQQATPEQESAAASTPAPESTDAQYTLTQPEASTEVNIPPSGLGDLDSTIKQNIANQQTETGNEPSSSA